MRKKKPYLDDRIVIRTDRTWGGVEIDLTQLLFANTVPKFTVARHEAEALANALVIALGRKPAGNGAAE